jgi:hypothetical protein
VATGDDRADNAAVQFDRTRRIAAPHRDVGAQNRSAAERLLLVVGTVEPPQRILELAAAQRALGHLAVVMRNRAWLLRLRHLLQAQVGRGGVRPVALQLVNAYEVLERRGGIARELLEQLARS